MDVSVRRQFSELIEEFKSRINREPSILNWGVDLNLSTMFPQLAIFSPVANNGYSHLPYLDQSIDIIVLGSNNADQLKEARRLAAVAVVTVTGSETNGSNTWHDVSSAISGVRVITDWRNDLSADISSTRASIIIPVYNNSIYTSKCLEQLKRTLPSDYVGEIIVVDDASTDDTSSLLRRWHEQDKRIKVVHNERNLGFIHSCNRGAEAATEDVLVFLNNDTLPQPGWLPPLLQVLRKNPRAGAVGGKLIYPDGTLQEAGGIIFKDGTGCNFGRNERFAGSPLFNFVREVDYCSGALLATPQALFIRLGGFDSYFAPAYYEDSDYCFRLRENGVQVYYQPESVIIHFEGISSGTSIHSGVKSYQEINRLKFIERWKEALKRQPKAPDVYDFPTLHALSIRNELPGDSYGD